MKVLKVHPDDNVLVALQHLSAGEQVPFNGDSYQVKQEIPAKHKFTTHAIAESEPIYMYGVLVGKAARNIDQGEWIHTENVHHASSHYERKTADFTWEAPDISRWMGKPFLGYHRLDGQVGTANCWLVIPLVFCENRNVQVLREAFEKELGYAFPERYRSQVRELVALHKQGKTPDEIATMTLTEGPVEERKNDPIFPNVEGIRFLTHEGGCGGTREDARNLCALFAGYLHHPNVAGATVLSLGCQNAQIKWLEEEIYQRNSHFDKPLLIYDQQQYGSETHLMRSAIRDTFLGLMRANTLERKPASLSHLTLGMECGGSDGFSGISANPAVGHTADLLVALGGSVILSEFPELCGVEQELINRCINEATAQRFIQLMRKYSQQAEAVGSSFDMNPSPGNIKDGLITDAIKSAGAAKKGGTSPIQQVMGYPAYMTKSGLGLLCTPGNDVESTTGLAGAGANIILFTTGLGTPTGNPIAPVVKVSSNTALVSRMPDIIDIDAGPIISGEKTIEEVGAEILDYVIELASGRIKTRAQKLGQYDFIPWKQGVSL